MRRWKSLLGLLLIVGMVLTVQTSVSSANSVVYNATGYWDFKSASTCWAGPGMTPGPPLTGTAQVTQSGSNVTIVYNTYTYTGTVSGSDYTVSRSYLDDGGTTTEWIRVTLTSSFTAFGSDHWQWTDGMYYEWGGCEGAAIKQGYENYAILHRDGAIYNSDTNWNLSPYYPGTAWVADMEFNDSGGYVLLHKDGALWRSSGGWLLTTPPYYPGTDYARALELVANNGYVILHKDGAIYRATTAATGWDTAATHSYPGSNYAVDLELK